MDIVRRNNPGNIRTAQRKWQGEVTPQGAAFCHFSSIEYGCRAMLKLLRNYIVRHKQDTVRQIVSRWAPPNENNTAAYMNYVAGRMGITADTHLRAGQKTLIALASAMTFMEHGRDLSPALWHKAYTLLDN